VDKHETFSTAATTRDVVMNSGCGSGYCGYTADMPETHDTNSDGEIREPENSTVNDWFGQKVAEDEETADDAVTDAEGDLHQAERIYEERAKGKEHYDAGHPRS
jgi:hypothetical protein